MKAKFYVQIFLFSVSLLPVDDGDDHFVDGRPSDAVREHIKDLRLDLDAYCDLVKRIEPLFELDVEMTTDLYV